MKGKKLFSAAGSAALAVALIFTNMGAGSLFAAGTQKITDANVFFANPSSENPLGGASDFNGVIFGNISGFADSEGPVASSGKVDVTHQISYPAGNLYLSHSPGSWISYDDIDDGIAAVMNVGLILGETVDEAGAVHTGSCAKNVDSGTVIVGPTSSYTGNAYPKKYEDVEAADKFMQDAKAKLTYQNTSLFSKAPNGDVVRNAENTPEWEALGAYGREVIVFKGTDSDWNVFRVNFDDVAAMSSAIWAYDIPEGSKVLMNITASGNSLTVTQGSNDDLLNFFPSAVCAVPYLGKSITDAKGRMATAEFAGRVLWNVDPKITKVTYRAGSNYIMGSLLAPKADLNSTGSDGSSSVNGTLVINNATGTGGSELHWFKFRGEAGGTGDISEATTEATTIAPAEDPDQPSGGEDPDQPSGGEDPDQPSGGEDPDQPSGGEDPDQPSGGEDPDQPSGGEDPDQPSGGEDPDQPSGGEDPDQPSGGEDPDQPSGGEDPDVTEPAVTIPVVTTAPVTTIRPPVVITGTTASVTTPKITFAPVTTTTVTAPPSGGQGSAVTSAPLPDRPDSDNQTAPVSPDTSAADVNPSVSENPSGIEAVTSDTSDIALGAGVEDSVSAETGSVGIIVLSVCGLCAVCALALGRIFRRKAK